MKRKNNEYLYIIIYPKSDLLYILINLKDRIENIFID
jgi:hypothetical protein